MVEVISYTAACVLPISLKTSSVGIYVTVERNGLFAGNFAIFEKKVFFFIDAALT